MPFVLGFRALDDGESHAREDVLELIADDSQRMTMAERRHAARQRDVDRTRRRTRRVERGTLLGDARFDVGLEIVGELPERRTLVGRRGRHRLHERGDDAALARKVSIAHGLEIPIRRGAGEGRVELVPQPGDGRWSGDEVRHGVESRQSIV